MNKNKSFEGLKLNISEKFQCNITKVRVECILSVKLKKGLNL